MDKKKSEENEENEHTLTQKIRSIMEQVKFQAKLQEKINPPQRIFTIHPDQKKES